MSEWIKTEENNLPKFGQKVLVVWNGAVHIAETQSVQGVTGETDYIDWLINDRHYIDLEDGHCWMPLPEIPK